MEYTVIDIYENKHTYLLDYQDLKRHYESIISYSYYEFKKNLPKILHYSCFVGFLKNLPSEALLADECLIHELAHYIDNTIEFDEYQYEKIKKLFEILKLS